MSTNTNTAHKGRGKRMANRTEVFEVCWTLEPATVGQIVAETGMHPCTVREHLVGLERAGEVFRIPDEDHQGPDLWMTAKTDSHRRAAAVRARAQRAGAGSKA